MKRPHFELFRMSVVPCFCSVFTINFGQDGTTSLSSLVFSMGRCSAVGFVSGRRGGAIGKERTSAALETQISSDIPLSPELRHAMVIDAKQYFDLVTSINKHKQVAAFVKQFATKTRAITEVVKGLEELLLPRYPEAFLGASCLFDKKEDKQLFLQRYLELRQKSGC
nr:unnamed protein product [Haemonchus contortus]